MASRGVRLTSEGSTLYAEPRESLNDLLRYEIRSHKSELLALLSTEARKSIAPESSPSFATKAEAPRESVLESFRRRGISLWLEVANVDSSRWLTLAYDAPAGTDAQILELELLENSDGLLAELCRPREIAATFRANQQGAFIRPTAPILATLRALNQWAGLSLPIQALSALAGVCEAAPTMSDTDLLDFFLSGLDERGAWTNPNQLAAETEALAHQRADEHKAARVG